MAKTQIYAFVVLVTLMGVSGSPPEGAKFIDCFLGRGHATVDYLQVDQCKDFKGCACDLRAGSNATVELKFTPAEDFNGIHYFVDIFHAWPIGFQRLAAGEVCHLPGIKCPGKAHVTENISITFKVDVPPSRLTLGLFVLLYREDRQQLVCQTVAVNVNSKKSLAHLITAHQRCDHLE